jgi:hypothetical protein
MGRILFFKNLSQMVGTSHGWADHAPSRLLQSKTIVAKPSCGTYTWSPVGAEITQH